MPKTESGRLAAAFRRSLLLLAVGLSLAATSSVKAADFVAEPVASAPDLDPARPSVLSERDRGLYTRIFALQARGDMRSADRLIKQIDNDVLMGHVLFQRYMHPTAYRSRYSELASWLSHYRDHPGADRIYKLALKRRPGGAAAPKKPAGAVSRAPENSEYAVGRAQRISYSRAYRRAHAKVRSLLRRERPTQALGYVTQASVRKHLNQTEFDALRADIAGSYFLEDKEGKAFDIAHEIAERNRAAVPIADWHAGLSAWRMGRIADAAHHFEALAKAPGIGDWTRAAGAFWAARARLANREADKVVPLLEMAADTGATFYGLLAAQQLGDELRFTWVEPALDRAGLSLLLTYDFVARAVALTEIGRRDLAEAEILRRHGAVDPSLDHALIALTGALNLPASQLKVANAIHVPSKRTGERQPDGSFVMNAGLFPIPDYEPADGFRVDRALVYAFMRQESQFKPKARSYAGASGLMQIMPATAVHIADDRSLRRSNRDKLFDPAFNLSLGQQYIEELMNAGDPYGNLFMLTTAYNGGPGNLSRWRRNTDYRNDPLLFIESIPSAETRGYIERVVTNLWIYHHRLGQPAPSLEAAAAGGWPIYTPLDQPSSLASSR